MATFNMEATISGKTPQTPPYTPHRNKRPVEVNDSPGSVRSVRSVQPAETESPDIQADRQQSRDGVVVEELTEGDPGYITDVELIYPDELEEVESDSADESDNGSESGDDISSRLSRLGCDDDSPEAEFEKKRRAEHLRKRRDSRAFKRSHSQSVKSDTDVTDPDAMADHDVQASARRLRRRVRGPGEVNAGMDGVVRSSSQLFGLASSPEFLDRPGTANSSDSGRLEEIEPSEPDTMDIDQSK